MRNCRGLLGCGVVLGLTACVLPEPRHRPSYRESTPHPAPIPVVPTVALAAQPLPLPNPAVDTFRGHPIALASGRLAIADSPNASVVIYERGPGRQWGPPVSLKVSGPGCGSAGKVQLSSDTLAVRTAGGEGCRTGGVRLYRRLGPGRWVEEAFLTPQDPACEAGAFSLAGDHLALSTAWRGPSKAVGGPVFVFQRREGRWSFVEAVAPREGFNHREPGGGSDTEHFGYDVAISDSELLVGAGAPSQMGNNAAYLFHRAPGGAFTQSQRVVSGSHDGMDGFGARVALAGAVAVIGAPSASWHQGQTYALVRQAGSDALGPLTKVFPQADEAGLRGSEGGSFVATDGRRVVLSHPGLSLVLIFELGPRGQWTPVARLGLSLPPVDQGPNRKSSEYHLAGYSVAFDGEDYAVSAGGRVYTN